MPDHPVCGLPRVALVYGQDAAVEHVRDAVGGHVEVVYATAASEFDVARMLDAHATAALVNLDDGDWLGAIESSLHDAGIAVVYNDPENSRGLDGWERARWLRHLVAKLCGSRNVDPPRPESVEPQLPPVAAVVAATVPEAAAETVSEAAPAPVALPADAAAAELPLSPEEIETMTVALVAEHDPVNTSRVDDAGDVNQSSPADVMAMDLAVEEAAASATSNRTSAAVNVESTTHASPSALPDTDFGTANELDVDTEALSAMIDARLAEPEAATPSDSPQVWRVVSGGAVSPVQLGAAVDSASAEATLGTPPVADRAVTPQDDADVLASLPSLDDWQLVDPEVPVAKTEDRASKAAEPVLPDSFAGLELVPMETILPVKINADPIERWLHQSDSVRPHAETDAPAKASGGKS